MLGKLPELTFLVSSSGALAHDGHLVNLGRALQQQQVGGGATAEDNSVTDVPGCRTPWETFNSTAELSFWAEALQTVGFAGMPLSQVCSKQAACIGPGTAPKAQSWAIKSHLCRSLSCPEPKLCRQEYIGVECSATCWIVPAMPALYALQKVRLACSRSLAEDFRCPIDMCYILHRQARSCDAADVPSAA